MIGKQLSRWTMAWFAAALAFLLAALGLAVLGAAGPGRWSSGPGLAVLHLFALGWLCQMMLGALIQFTPVLAARPLALARLALPALLACSFGTALLAGGFLALDGWEPGFALLAAAPLPLALAFALVGAMVAATLLAVRGWRQDAGRTVLAALLALAALWASGAGMALALSGSDIGMALLPEGVPLHVLLGVGGWLTLSAIGVSYQLFPMFLLAPDRGSRLRDAGFACALLVLGLILAGLAALLLGGGAALPLLLPLAALASAAVVALYLAEARRMWQARRRPQPELNMQWSRAALAFLALAVLLSGPALWRGGVWAEAAVFAALVGWLSTLTLAQMVKIASFLTWIQVFSPLIGRRPVPMVHELTGARAAGRWLALWAAAAAGGTAALLAGFAPGFRLAALGLLVAALGLCREAVLIRRLRHLAADRRPALLPPMILPPSPRRSDHDHPRTAGA
ncbi:hypothetical protein [Paracoccus sp. TOH]|uniref:hypothetical protein n=1 Tax=Paracoccus sp. TOH TaxID=1263728 RepID=UPI0025B12EEB|nr:hypothetical protein [Paracoccus sp. TOH]WJS86927.1 hypothetical protein NBE95_17895 [Paracoccus sp. TOH]